MIKKDLDEKDFKLKVRIFKITILLIDYPG